MTNSPVTSDSILAIDIGPVKTRALLFDIVDGRYRFLAAGSTNSTIGHPYFDVGKGVRLAIKKVSAVTGRVFLDEENLLISPTRPDGSGVDQFSLTISAGSPVKIMAVGLVQDVSVQSARNLAGTINSKVVRTMSLTNPRSLEKRIDTILKHQPDIIIIAGGMDGGATNSMRKLIKAVGLACSMLPRTQLPQIIYAGNQKIWGCQKYILSTAKNFPHIKQHVLLQK